MGRRQPAVVALQDCARRVTLGVLLVSANTNTPASTTITGATYPSRSARMAVVTSSAVMVRLR